MNVWERLVAALHEMNAWYGEKGAMSAFVGVEENGRYYAGAHYDAEPWSDDPYGEGPQYQADGDSIEEVLDALIARLTLYRAEMDRLRAEEAAEEAAYAAERVARALRAETP